MAAETDKIDWVYDRRKDLHKKIEELRSGRTLICLFNFDKPSNPAIPGVATQFNAEVKGALFRVLRETVQPKAKIDLCLYTRGGDTNSVWPIVSLLREFDPEFEILVPFRCHSSGTLVALGARRICMTELAELSPIDPSTGNQFNPPDPQVPGGRLAISVEDVTFYRRFVEDHLQAAGAPQSAPAFLDKLVSNVHPLALGNVHRVHHQIQMLAKNLLSLNPLEKNLEEAVASLTSRFYSHIHMINRHEAREILGDRIEFAPDALSTALNELLRAYENRFELRKPFLLNVTMGDTPSKQLRFIGGIVESKSRSYVFETEVLVQQSSKLPANVQVQIPVGQPMPLIPGLPREYNVDLRAQGWVHNKAPKGVSL